ncbi:hypothetical protein QOT17_013566 [Balamuthia mandrillaris]
MQQQEDQPLAYRPSSPRSNGAKKVAIVTEEANDVQTEEENDEDKNNCDDQWQVGTPRSNQAELGTDLLLRAERVKRERNEQAKQKQRSHTLQTGDVKASNRIEQKDKAAINNEDEKKKEEKGKEKEKEEEKLVADRATSATVSTKPSSASFDPLQLDLNNVRKNVCSDDAQAGEEEVRKADEEDDSDDDARYKFKLRKSVSQNVLKKTADSEWLLEQLRNCSSNDEQENQVEDKRRSKTLSSVDMQSIRNNDSNNNNNGRRRMASLSKSARKTPRMSSHSSSGRRKGIYKEMPPVENVGLDTLGPFDDPFLICRFTLKKYYLQEGLNTIGRAHTTITMNEATMSRQHCAILIENGKLWISDRNSTHGTFVGRQRITDSTQLTKGVKLRLGERRLVLDWRTPLIEGELCKRSPAFHKSWQKRYCVLRLKCRSAFPKLYYYKTSKSKEPLGKLDIRDIIKVTDSDKPNIFTIKTKNRTYEMRASSESLRNEWSHAFALALRNLREGVYTRNSSRRGSRSHDHHEDDTYSSSSTSSYRSTFTASRSTTLSSSSPSRRPSTYNQRYPHRNEATWNG